MRYVFFALILTAMGIFWLNNSQDGRKILRNMEAVGERNSMKYR